ncbi:hypothetical protein EJB05_27397 [Eragrostis curvula]|uniref:CCHC-type domain-containing protein n=1 Tax=Eragrostis curvula TaxID=38414 RepID=A0A5J9UP56_9POAL|nr:hypothetical protein EJB05_27397 [Eragrostis curvula]
MAQRWRSRARRDPDLDDDGGGSPPAEVRRSDGDDDDEEAGNEDLSLEIVARAARRQRRSRRRESADALSVSSGEEVDEDAVVELGEAPESRRKQRKKQRRKLRKKQRKEAGEAAAAGPAVAAGEEEEEVGGTQEAQTGTAESVLTEDGVDVPASENIVLRKLLGQDCFICKKGGHMAKDCPDKHKKHNQQSTLCLRCGETGHDMFGCFNDYPPDDIKEIKCYVCKQNGHLCCANFSDTYPKDLTCYNCAQSGHTGLGCAKQRRETSAVTTPTVCYKCGEEGHFARGCTKNAKSSRSKGESSARSRRKDKGKDFSARSAPYDARKSSKRKSPHFEDRMDSPWHKSKARGGWNGDDDLDDLPFKKYKPNRWASPSTPKKHYNNHQFSSGDGDYFTPQSSRRRNRDYASPSSNYSPNARRHGSSSRFATSSTHVRFSGS